MVFGSLALALSCLRIRNNSVAVRVETSIRRLISADNVAHRLVVESEARRVSSVSSRYVATFFWKGLCILQLAPVKASTGAHVLSHWFSHRFS